VVLSSGKKVHTEEVEQALGESPHFHESCAIGLPAENGGEQVVAVVQPTVEFRQACGEKLQLDCEREAERVCRKLAAFKRPSKVVVRLDSFPRTSSGKIKRHLVRESL
jgi:long-chain acyl-CoA synthetase